uniref:Uncharacterized protein n=1 Tax=Rhizophora mucronata TaxID=61149 RepID=A0A2P2QSS2_RHIMU
MDLILALTQPLCKPITLNA